MEDYAWLCGQQGEYFSGLFSGLMHYIHSQTETVMVLCDGCDMKMIHGFATANGFVLNCIYSSQNLLERNFIFKISKQ